MHSESLYSEPRLPFITSSHALKPNHKKVDISILSAMPEELEIIEDFLKKHQHEIYKIDELEFKVYHYKNKKILLAYTGLGTTFAACVLTLIYQNFHPEYVLFLGTAGGIHPKVRIGDVVIAEQAFEA